MKISDINQLLNTFAEDHQLIGKTIECCKEYLYNWKKEEPDEYKKWFEDKDIDELMMEFKSYSYCFENSHIDYNYIVTTLYVFIDPNFLATTYSLIVNMDGEIVDDYLS